MKESECMRLERQAQNKEREAMGRMYGSVLLQYWLYGMVALDSNGKLVCPLDF